MNVRTIMTKAPGTCHPDASLQEAARLMVEHDCGAVPVVERTGKAIGVITDRDITCRAVAQGRNPLDLKVSDCMTAEVVSVTPDTSLEECVELMEENQIRRIVVVDDHERCIGIVAQADLARLEGDQARELVEAVSRPDEEASIPASHQ